MATYCPEDGEDGELFSCPICFEDYDLLDARRAPKLLLCLHTFCYECTQKLWKNDGSLECSMCRMLHEKVRLEDLFDNHVIIQHLQREREEKDLEFARKIDQEMRSEFGGSPVIVAENAVTIEQNDERDGYSDRIEFLDIADESIEANQSVLIVHDDNNPRVSDMDEDQEDDDEEEDDDNEVEAEVNERNDSQNQIFQGLLNSLRVSQEVRSVSDEEIESSGVVNHPTEDVAHQDDSSDESNEDDSGNPSFCIEDMQKLLEGDDDEDIEEEDVDEEEEEEVVEEEVEEDEEQSEDELGTNVEINENPTFMVENIQCLFGYTDNDDDDDDDERFHSACDDISTTYWGGDDDLAMQDGSEEDADTNAFCWQIVNSESIFED